MWVLQICLPIPAMSTVLPPPAMQMYLLTLLHRLKSFEITKELGGGNYVFWGGREGYETLLNTDMKLELDNFARFLHWQ